MPYTHFGNQADVWKHLALCEAVSIEKPQTYIETNAASAVYTLSNNPEQTFGILRFLEKSPDFPGLKNSLYYTIESNALTGMQYVGSPGLALTILKDITSRFIFFDIEKPPLDNIRAFAGKLDLHEKVETMHQDSLTGLMDMLPEISRTSFVHIDPYFIDRPDPEGYGYMDIFAEATKQGIRCFLWYGFHTLVDKARINDYIRQKLAKAGIMDTLQVELILKVIQEDTIACNPGILGSGLLCSNLSAASVSAILNYSNLLTQLYKGTQFEGFSGDLYREIL